MVRDQWFSGKRRKFKQPKKNVGFSLCVLEPDFFLRRDPDGHPVTGDFSELNLQQASDRYSSVVVFAALLASLDVDKLKSTVAELELDNFRWIDLVDQKESAYTAYTDELKRCIIELGGQIKHVQNPREISYLNIDRFVFSGDIIFARRDDHEKVGIELDKPKSFKELHKARKRRSFW